jgi:hypothetical protein
LFEIPLPDWAKEVTANAGAGVNEGELTAQSTGFIDDIVTVTPDVVVTEASALSDAIANNSKIGIANADVLAELATLVNNGTTSSDYRNLKVSLYQRASSSTAFYPLGIYITATGDNGRTFLDIYGGVESLENNANHGGFAEPNVRIGNL